MNKLIKILLTCLISCWGYTTYSMETTQPDNNEQNANLELIIKSKKEAAEKNKIIRKAAINFTVKILADDGDITLGNFIKTICLPAIDYTSKTNKLKLLEPYLKDVTPLKRIIEELPIQKSIRAIDADKKYLEKLEVELRKAFDYDEIELFIWTYFTGDKVTTKVTLSNGRNNHVTLFKTKTTAEQANSEQDNTVGNLQIHTYIITSKLLVMILKAVTNNYLYEDISKDMANLMKLNDNSIDLILLFKSSCSLINEASKLKYIYNHPEINLTEDVLSKSLDDIIKDANAKEAGENKRALLQLTDKQVWFLSGATVTGGLSAMFILVLDVSGLLPQGAASTALGVTTLVGTATACYYLNKANNEKSRCGLNIGRNQLNKLKNFFIKDK